MKTRALLLLALLCVLPVFAHAAPSATIAWTAPTTAVDGSALTGAQALTNYQVWVSSSPILDTSTAPPTVTLSNTVTTTTQTVSVPAGGTVYARVKACIVQLCSAFSAQASMAVPLSAPGIPTSVTVTITVAP